MNLAGGLAIVAESEAPVIRKGSTDDVVLWDMTNPTSPRVVQRFSGVIKWLEDERSFLYVLNGDGLWVISEPTVPKSESTDSYNAGG
jgi:hypothetical protein